MIYQCLNRLDENPFKRYNKTGISSQEKWWINVNTPCEGGKDWRRCLGESSDKCILATGNKLCTLKSGFVALTLLQITSNKNENCKFVSSRLGEHMGIWMSRQ